MLNRRRVIVIIVAIGIITVILEWLFPGRRVSATGEGYTPPADRSGSAISAGGRG